MRFTPFNGNKSLLYFVIIFETLLLFCEKLQMEMQVVSVTLKMYCSTLIVSFSLPLCDWCVQSSWDAAVTREPHLLSVSPRNTVLRAAFFFLFFYFSLHLLPGNWRKGRRSSTCERSPVTHAVTLDLLPSLVDWSRLPARECVTGCEAGACRSGEDTLA